MKSTSRHALTLEILTRTLQATGRLGTQIAKVLGSSDHRKAISVTINPKGYSDWRDFCRDYLALNLVKKYPFLQLPGVNPRVVALEKFVQSERRCYDINFMLCHPSTIPHDARQLLSRARRECRRILGKFSWDSILPFLSHGPGATYGTRRDSGHPWYKFGELQPTVTGDCLALHRSFIKYGALWGNIQSELGIVEKIVPGSKITTVPKDARSDRVIAIEPLLNMFYQKGIGGLMRSRLRRVGCDLNDQSINQKLAETGSRLNSLCTIDLSSASDSIARSLVEFLLPEDWVVALNITRSHFTELEGERKFLQKFSSMGNGFTFELESLIFLAFGRAAISLYGGTESVISVYGDDIVVTPDVVHQLIYGLSVFGFKTNAEKSFVDGPFRESCGKHYFLGRDVTPLYVKADVQTDDRYLWYLNQIRRFAHRLIGMGYGCSDRYKPLWDFLYSRLAPRFRKLSVPEGYGDGGVLRDLDECVPRPRVIRHQVEGFTTSHLTRRYAEFEPHGWPQLLVSLFRLGISESRAEQHRMRPKDCTSLGIPLKRYRYTVVKLHVTRWSCIGPWVSEL